MFNKQSRYYKLDNLAVECSDGFTVEGKQLRRQPETEGKLFYRIESGDRIDHLAYKFFGRSKQWWHICDANPEFFSPRELLGTTPVKRLRIAISFQGYQPEWVTLFSGLQQLLGVQQVLHGTHDQPQPTRELTFSMTASLAVIPDTARLLLDQAVLAQTIPVALNTLLSGEGISLGSTVRIHKDGDNIWYVDDVENQIIYACVLIFNDDPIPDVVNLFEVAVSHTWSLGIFYNQNSISSETLLDEVLSVGFDVDNYEFIGRVGKKISVPTKYIG